MPTVIPVTPMFVIVTNAPVVVDNCIPVPDAKFVKPVLVNAIVTPDAVVLVPPLKPGPNARLMFVLNGTPFCKNALALTAPPILISPPIPTPPGPVTTIAPVVVLVDGVRLVLIISPVTVPPLKLLAVDNKNPLSIRLPPI